MGIFLDKNSRVIVQGFTGKEGVFHSRQMISYGTILVGGVSPGKEGQSHLNRPIFNNVHQAIKATGADVSVIFVPPYFASDAIIEASNAGIKIVVCITEGIPIADMIKVKQYIKNRKTRLIGPNCPGIITTEVAKVGIMPGFVFKQGCVGIVSKSGTLMYEAAYQVVKAGYGISTAIGIGGDPIIGTTTKEVVELFMEDDQTDAIVMIGEIGGELEAEAAHWVYAKGNKKPVIGFIAGQTAPIGRTMGHAGAIVGGKEDSAFEKMKILERCGIHVVNSPAEIGTNVAKFLL
ncbi:succinyl-CoA synthetase, alpha subunit [Candidatus Uzinura diaspidicola str. ASNER]|uniref:Succinate--CoA ligase [ADP-forming] subunit alpha n=1 Tax=Candidatus Uzinura diaspidicola str. ASNER TaxID=1133592 RepID=L7VG76_9FLAO|nr:succinyl-CoA synthetase, alpha subunit [Candidatus Uzinura diaspidicola str. ASNER]